jgi:hypothetical protein
MGMNSGMNSGGFHGGYDPYGQPTSARINVNHQYELRYWASEFRVDESTLKAAVRAVGPSAAAVREHLNRTVATRRHR